MTSVVRKETNFVAINQDNAPRHLSINPKAERISTLISAGSEFVGEMRCKEGIKVDGKVVGDLNFGIEDGLCIINKGAVVEGNVKGPRILVMGEVLGDLYIDELVILAPTALIMGKVCCARFVTYDGAQIEGSIETRRKVEPEHSAEPAEQEVKPKPQRGLLFKVVGNG